MFFFVCGGWGRIFKSGGLYFICKMDYGVEGRVETGVPGLDELVEGGLRRGSINLVSGGCGSGKTIFCVQYVYHGAMIGENSVYITFEETPESLKANTRRFGWDLDVLEAEDKLRIVSLRPTDILDLVKKEHGPIIDALESIDAKRLVIDPVSTVELMIENAFDRRKYILELCKELYNRGYTCLMTHGSDNWFGRQQQYGLIGFLVDGIILLYYSPVGGRRVRALEVLKMRGTRHREGVFPLEIGDSGVRVFPDQGVASLSGEPGVSEESADDSDSVEESPDQVPVEQPTSSEAEQPPQEEEGYWKRFHLNK